MKVRNYKQLKRPLLLLCLIAALMIGWIWNRREIELPHAAQAASGKRDGKMTNSVIQEPAEDRAEKLKAMVQTSNVPISFWGKVIDEAGTPIPKALINYRIQRARLLGIAGIGPEKGVKSTISTDERGLFRILNTRGVLLEFEGFEKVGFLLMSNQPRTFAYSRSPEIHAPNEHSPQVFVMKSNIARNAVKSIRGKFELPWDGSALRIDLETGKVSQSGQLMVTAFRSAARGQVRGFEWRLSIKIDNGELIQEAAKEVAFIAPEHGYSSEWSSGSTSGAIPWRSGYRGNVYYRVNGKYGRLNLEIYADSRESEIGLHFESFLNESGGRSTEVSQ